MVGRLRRHVYALTREVAARESWESEMKFAHQVQVSLMPAGSPAFPDRDELELCGVYRPARHVAGDFFDYFMLDDNRLFLIIADVSGKGMASALLMEPRICEKIVVVWLGGHRYDWPDQREFNLQQDVVAC